MEHEPAVREFNARLGRGGVEFRFPERHRSPSLPPSSTAPLWQDYFVACDDAGVRGGYILKTEQLFAKGEALPAGNYQLPLSEGIIERAYSLVGVKLLWDALARQDKLYCLGMGGTERPLPRMLARLGWAVELVPFYFRVVHAGAFLKHIRFLRAKPSRAALLDVAAVSGLGSLGLGVWNLCSALRAPRLSEKTGCRRVESFGPAADRLFSRVLSHYPALFDRRSEALALKFPVSDERFRRLLVERDGELVGWALLTCSQLSGHKQFGNMKLGAIADSLALPGFEASVVGLAYASLCAEKVDLVVSNQSHARWRQAFRSQGFLEGPSNFALARSPALRDASGPLSGLHITRGDGDGPIHL